MPLLGEAPCQCFSPGGSQTVSPGRISMIGPPFVCTRPTPETTNKVCPSGWVCHAVRAPGSKATRAELTRAGPGGVLIGSCQTVPVNQSLDARRVGREPAPASRCGEPNRWVRAAWGGSRRERYPWCCLSFDCSLLFRGGVARLG